MEAHHINKKLAGLMCIIFATHLLTLLYNSFGWLVMSTPDKNVYNIIHVILIFPILIAAYLIATKENLFITKAAKITSMLFFGIQIFYILNNLCNMFFGNYILGLIGNFANITIQSLFLIITVLFYILLPLWKPVKTLGVISTILSIVPGVLFILPKCMESTNSFGGLFYAVGTTVWIEVLLYAAALILSIIWASRKSDYTAVPDRISERTR